MPPLPKLKRPVPRGNQSDKDPSNLTPDLYVTHTAFFSSTGLIVPVVGEDRDDNEGSTLFEK